MKRWMEKSILIVEDEMDIAQGLQELFCRNRYRVSLSSCLSDARKLILERDFSVYLLDVLLPDGYSFELCQEIRAKTEAPILFLTAMDDEDSVIRGLKSGGDDYVTKPFRTRELLSRVEANLRRYQNISSAVVFADTVTEVDAASDVDTVTDAYTIAGTLKAADGRQRLCFGELFFDALAGKVYLQGVELPLRKIEYRLLEVFLENAGVLLTRELLLQKLWDNRGEFVEDNTLSVEVSRLRKKIGSYQGKPYIETIRGIGYRFQITEPE